MINKELSQDILQMARLDQKARKAKVIDWPTVAQIDKTNTEHMKKIVAKFGWPTDKLVGKKASHMAWLLVQHADTDIHFQEHCLKLMCQADARKVEIAYLTDRVLTNRGQMQIYGTQFRINKQNKRVLFPVKSPRNLVKRRKIAGLDTP